MSEANPYRTLTVDTYFDGEDHHKAGPYVLCLAEGAVTGILTGDAAGTPDSVPAPFNTPGVEHDRAAFAMPGLVEAHAHLFQDGSVLDFKHRTDYLKNATHADMMAVARDSVDRSLAAGITLVRDAGDIHGINIAVREELRETDGPVPDVRAPGSAIRKKGRYGSFVAVEVEDLDGIRAAVNEIAPGADDIKILMTGIIDFKIAEVKGKPQFTSEEAGVLVETAKRHGRLTFAHCSGLLGIRRAINAGIDSIEHGFFVDRETLGRMADLQTAWVPTFAPVQFQWARPDIAGWDDESVAGLRRILDGHREQLLVAAELGVPIVAGTDAGSPGVPHGEGLIDELKIMRETGLTVLEILRSATSRPRRLWGCANDRLSVGSPVDIITLDGSPFEHFEAVENLQSVYVKQSVSTPHTPVC